MMRLNWPVAILAGAVVVACGGSSARTLTHWDGNSEASFSLTAQTTVHVVAKAKTAGCSIVVGLQSDSGTVDQFAVTSAGITKDLVLAAGNWSVGAGDQGPASVALIDCLYGGLDLTVTG
jgi:hypothetical protein